MVANCDLKNEHKHGRFQLTKEECSKSQIVTLNEERGQFYGEKRFRIQPLRNNGILVRKKGVFHGQVSQNDNLPGRRRGFTDESRNRDFHTFWLYALKMTSHVTEDRASE